jgi:hypothetical protein
MGIVEGVPAELKYMKTSKKFEKMAVFGLIVILIALLGTACPKKKGSGEEGFTGRLPYKISADTTLGINVRSERAINSLLLPSIDAGWSKAMRIAAEPPNNYPRPEIPVPIPEHRQATVGLWERSPKCINPGFLIRADGSPWDGTEFDKDPRPGKVLLCIAGIAGQYSNSVGNEPGGTYGMLVVDDPGLMETIVWYEAEHEILKGVHASRWESTAGIHAHPIMGYGDALKTVDPPFTAWMFEVEEDANLADREVKKGERYCLLITK